MDLDAWAQDGLGRLGAASPGALDDPPAEVGIVSATLASAKLCIWRASYHSLQVPGEKGITVTLPSLSGARGEVEQTSDVVA